MEEIIISIDRDGTATVFNGIGIYQRKATIAEVVAERSLYQTPDVVYG